MQRWTALGLVALLVAFIATVFVAGTGPRPNPRPAVGAEAPKDAGADAQVEAGPSLHVDAGEAPSPSATDEPAAPGAEPPIANRDAGATLIDGSQPSALPTDAPKSVVFGVILVQYKGAQGASPNARPREAALQMAKDLAVEAKQDFKAAIAKGDKGSMENAGRMPRGMIEAAPEFVLFSLPKDGVSDPVDTPRGYWIVRRIE